MERAYKGITTALVAGITVCLCLITYMLADMAFFRRDDKAVAAVTPPALEFQVNADTVEVFDQGGEQPFQTISFDPESLTELNRDSFLQTPDINFDGYPDLLLIYSQGAQNVYYDGWIWRAGRGQFEYDPIIRELASPTFDEGTKQIHTYEHGSATDHETGIWQYEDGELEQIERVVQELNGATGKIDIRTYRRNAAGRLELVEERSYTPEELQKLNQG